MKQKFLSSMVLLLFVASCATMSTSTTPKAAYLKARLEFNTLLQQYLTYYREAPPATQQQWKEQIDPLFKQAAVALDLWGLAVKQGQSGTEQQQEYIKLKNKLLDALFPILGGK